MVSISVRKERFSHAMLLETGEFVINLTTEKLVYATDYCGVKSGRDVEKCKELGLHLLPGKEVKVPRLAESPVNIECRVTEVKLKTERQQGRRTSFVRRPCFLSWEI